MTTSNIGDISRAEKVSVLDIGQIGAGTTVEYLPSVRKRRITRPRNTRIKDDLVSARVSGDSLRDDGILDGDRVICRRNFEMSEIKNGKLVVVRLPCGALALKHFHLIDDGYALTVRLVSANPFYPNLEYDLNDVKVEALVIESVRSWS